MAGTKVEITYHGKPEELNLETRKVIQYCEKYTIKDSGNWKENFIKEFKRILDEFEGISEIRFFV